MSSSSGDEPAAPRFVSWPRFEAELERFQRKYPHIVEDLREALTSPNTRSDAVAGYGHNLYKLRVRSRDLRRGSSGGFRVYLWVERDPPPAPPTVYPVTMYLKSERADLSVDELRDVLERFFQWAPQSRKRRR
jgi:mRNA-degrading endonuclease RelE of RelBE toxin-antitoxin system